MLFVGFYFVPNLIVILFNLMYPVFVVGIYCKGVWLRECEVSSNWSKEGFRGYLATKHPAKRCKCPAHDWNAKSQYRWRQLSREYLAGKAFPRDTRETFYFARLYYLIHTFCTYTIYTHITHKWWGELLRESPSKNTWELEIVIPTILYTFICGISLSLTFPFSYHWEVDRTNTYHTLWEC